MGVVFTGSCFSCHFFMIRHTRTLVISAVTAENTTPLTHTDSDTAFGKKTNKLFLDWRVTSTTHERCEIYSTLEGLVSV